jgi:hypothetical protein
VSSVIQRKLDQLGEVDRRLLSVASVQGYEFDSGVVARVLDLDAADVEERLEALDRVHALVRLWREQEFPDGALELRYQLVHVLYQNALYDALQPTRRASYSAAVARVLLDHYGERSAAIAGELALLLKTARDWERAVEFFLIAAQNAARVHAHREAVALARQGLELLPRLPETPDRAQTELRLQVAIGISMQFTVWGSPEVARAEAGEGRPSPAGSAAARPHDPDPSGLPEGEACIRGALDVACRQGAKSFESRAALSLARLLRDRGRPAEGRRLLQATFGWFREGCDTPDLEDARTLLDELASMVTFTHAADG